MKQESVNTFNEGLNFDLNPLTTPNNILTDCVNGTFVTFNGDELALQNDSGNTTINSEVNPQLPVRLTPGYYPIGIKEYGGILYIVSACTPESLGATLWVSGTLYTAGKLVFILSEADIIYYRCILNVVIGVSTTVPGENSTYWELVPTEELSRIEFGSFPSPLRPNLNNKGSVPKSFSIDNDRTDLNNSAVINNGQFRAGNYIEFTVASPETIDTDNVSYYSYDGDGDSTYHIKAYRLRLLQQLTNGSIDLTPVIWLQYAKFKGLPFNGVPESLSFWFEDPNFKFYCPNNYKGKLAVITELEPLNSFKLISSTIDFNEGIYELRFEVTINNPTTLVIDRVQFWYWINGVIQPAVIANFSENIAIINIECEQGDPNLPIPKLTYQITPLLAGSLATLDYTLGDLPTKYITDNNYIITGSKLLTADYDNILLVKGLTDYRCDITTYNGDAFVTKFILKDNLENNLTQELVTTTDEYFFREYTEGATPNDKCIGNYTMDTEGNITFREFEMNINNISFPDFLHTLLERQHGLYYNNACNLVELTIVTNKVLSSGSTVTVSQVGVADKVMTQDLVNTDTYRAYIIPNLQFSVTADYGVGSDSGSSTIAIDSTFTLAIVCNNIQIIRTYSGGGDEGSETAVYLFYAYIPMPESMQSLAGHLGFFKSQCLANGTSWATNSFSVFNDIIDTPNRIGYRSGKLYHNPLTDAEFGGAELKFTEEGYSSPLPNVSAPWLNINPSDYLLVVNEIFPKTKTI